VIKQLYKNSLKAGWMDNDLDGDLQRRQEAVFFNRAIDLALSHGAKIAPTASWLDLGCHQGQFLRLLLSRFSVAAFGSDQWKAELKGESDAGWGYLQGDFLKGIPDFGRKFDFVSAFEVIEHIIDTDKFIEDIKKILKEDAWLLLSTPNINSLRNRVLVPFGRYPAGLEWQNVIHHVRLYNPSILKRQLNDHGFRIVWVHGFAFLPSLGTGTVSQRLGDLLPSF
jgi:2-polyprenyl-3-methyl-5-hydroxy-6-metoxy-1,4-benzoquinol methylase